MCELSSDEVGTDETKRYRKIIGVIRLLLNARGLRLECASCCTRAYLSVILCGWEDIACNMF